MADFQLDATAAEQLAARLAAAAAAVLQLEPVNRQVAQLFDGASDAPGRVVRTDATAGGVVVAAAWRHHTITVARSWFLSQLDDRYAAVHDLYLQHVTTVLADIGDDTP